MDGNAVRREVLIHAHRTGAGHIGSCLSCADILAVLADYIQPDDAFILSKGHAALAHLASIGKADEFPEYKYGIQEYMGSLGHGFPIACGIALTGRRAFVLMGDGECDEGTTWEAARFAVENDLPVTVIIDHNLHGGCKKVPYHMELPMRTLYVDGHDDYQMRMAFSCPGPVAIVCQTTKGKGVSFMEGDNAWHYKSLTDEQLEAALCELS